MKHVFLLLAMLVAASSVAFSQATGTTRVRSSGDEEVHQFFARVAAAGAHNDAVALESIWAPEYTFITSAGTVVTREQRLASIRSGDLKYESSTASEVSIRTYGDTAVASARVSLKGHAGALDISGDYRSTAVAVKKNGSWQIVAQQSTRIAQP